MRNISLGDFFETEDVDDAYTILCTTLRKGQDRVIPMEEIKQHRKCKVPWITKEILTEQKVRYKLYKKHKADPSNQSLALEYRAYRNRLCSKVRKAERDFYSKMIEDAEGNQSKTWHIINDILGRKRKPVNLPKKLRTESGLILSEPTEIANELNSFFTSVGEKLALKVPRSEIEPDNLMENLRQGQSFFLTPVTEWEVYTALLKIRTKKSCGPDGLHPRYIKDIALHIAQPLAYLINKSFSSGNVPKEMKTARVTPLFKRGNREQATNYRPISILPVFAKIFEGLMYERLMAYLQQHQILSKHQFGFQKGKSTKGALLRFINEIQGDLDKGLTAGAIYIDLTKAFDTVDHKILLKKLQIYGVRGIALEWFTSYLTSRTQHISCGETKSEAKLIRCGVPQGSNLGPLLFLIYLNDLPHCLQFGKPTLFADDTTVYNAASNAEQLVRQTNADLCQLAKWFQANKLTLNASKTYGCVFGNQPILVQEEIKVNGETIEMSNTVKYLGIFVDARLSWAPHIAQVTNKINQTMGALYKIRQCLPRSTMLGIYYSLIHSRLLYCLEVWGTACHTTLQPLIIAQKKAIRLVNNSGYRDHTAPIFQNLGVRPLLKEIHYRRALLAYEIIKSPERHDIQLNTTIEHRHNTRFASENLTVPRKRTWGWGTRGMEYLLIKAYNALPINIKQMNCASYSSYKNRLGHLFK